MAKTREQKNADVASLKDRLQNSKLVVLTDYRGLDVVGIDQLRSSLREAGIAYQVTKNTLVKLAIAGTDKASADLSVFNGPMAVAFGSDEISAAKLVYEFGRKNEALQIVGAIDEQGKVLSAEEVVALAKLPSREQLLGQLVGTLAAPVSGLVRTLNGNLTGLMYALNAISDKKAT